MKKNRSQYTSLKSLGTLAWQTVQLIGSTLSIEERFADEKCRRNSSLPVIYALWHGRMFVPMYWFRNTGVSILVSEHRDGEIVTNTLISAGLKAVRGSTTRGGVRALAKLVRLAKQGASIAFTSDGPQGPRWRLQPGVVFVAAKTGVPIVPISGSARFAAYFKSWDAFQLPLPFSKAVLNIGELYYVTGGSDPDTIERHRIEIERRITRLTLEADALMGVKNRP